MNVVKALLQWTFLLTCNIVLDILGLFIVAIAIPFRVDDYSMSDNRPITNLPKWAWLWGNDYDGLLGDKRGWWKDNTPFGWKVDSFLAMWWWAAIRNPVNNMRLVSIWQAPVRESLISYSGQADVEDKYGKQGWQFVTTMNKGKKWYGFYYVHCWSETKAFVVRFGFKVEPKHQGMDIEPKGMTIKINPYKDI